MDSARAAVRPLSDTRSVGEVGRRARLDLVFAVRGGRTEIVHQYVEPPFRVGRTFPEANGVHLILASSAPGIFGGDELDTTIVVERGARVRLTSQSSLQIHPSADGNVARLSASYRVERDAWLSCEWHPAIPFPAARLNQRNLVTLEPGAALFWSDAMMSGREARGERWQFAALAHELAIVRGGRLDYLERYLIEPGANDPAGRWRGNDACYFGTVISSAPDATREGAEALHRDLNRIDGVSAAADMIEAQLMLVRLMAASGPAFHRARATCALPEGSAV